MRLLLVLAVGVIYDYVARDRRDEPRIAQQA
jgi:hypothetical protein